MKEINARGKCVDVELFPSVHVCVCVCVLIDVVEMCSNAISK